MLASEVEVLNHYASMLPPGDLQTSLQDLSLRILDSNNASAGAELKFTILLEWVMSVAGAQQAQLDSINTQLVALREFVSMPEPAPVELARITDIASPEEQIEAKQAEIMAVQAASLARPEA